MKITFKYLALLVGIVLIIMIVKHSLAPSAEEIAKEQARVAIENAKAKAEEDNKTLSRMLKGGNSNIPAGAIQCSNCGGTGKMPDAYGNIKLVECVMGRDIKHLMMC